MKAIVQDGYGPPDILQLQEVEKPTPTDDEVLVKVQAACVNWANLALVKGRPRVLRLSYGLSRPRFRIPGGDVAGRIEAVGKNVSEFQPGDDVYGDLVDEGFGGFAEYVCASEKALALKPANLSSVEAAAVPQAALVALQGLRDMGQIREGQSVLINGASSGNGTFAVQIAKSVGAEVTGVCSGRNLDLVRSIGADHVIDYTEEDFTESPQRYDLILSNVGHHPLRHYKRALTPTGTFVMTGGPVSQILWIGLVGPMLSNKRGRTLKMLSHRTSKEDLRFMTDLIETGKVKPVVDRTYPLADAAEAFRYYDRRRSRGKVVLKVCD